MARVPALRVAVWIVMIAVFGCIETQLQLAATAQSWQSPMGQPMWANQAPMYQAGPNGAVMLDSPVMMQGGYPGGVGCGDACGPQCGGACGPQCGGPCGPCPQPMMYMMPQQPCPQPCVQQCVPQCAPPEPCIICTVFGDVLWLQPTGADMAHAQQQNGIGGAGTVPFGTIGVAEPDFDLGFRVGGEVQFAPCAAIFATYTYFENSTTSSLDAPVIPGGGGAVGSLVHHPGAALTASVGPVNATYDIEFQLGDAAYRQYLVKDNCRTVSVFGGGRFGSLNQDFLQSGIFGGGLGGAIDTSTSIEFTGGGPMAGIEAERQIDASGFSVYGRALVAALMGSFDSRYQMINTTTSTQLADASWSEDRIVPMLDYEIGLAWTGPEKHLRLAVGYMASHWFNVVTTPVFVDAVQANNYSDVNHAISFAGLVGQAEISW